MIALLLTILVEVAIIIGVVIVRRLLTGPGPALREVNVGTCGRDVNQAAAGVGEWVAFGLINLGVGVCRWISKGCRWLVALFLHWCTLGILLYLNLCQFFGCHRFSVLQFEENLLQLEVILSRIGRDLILLAKSLFKTCAAPILHFIDRYCR